MNDKTEAALRESEERFQGAFEYAAIGIALVSPEGKWLKVNSALCSIVGYSEEELLSLSFQDITHPDDMDADLKYVRQMLSGEIRNYHMEKRYYHKEGHLVWVLLSVSLVRDKERNPLYFVSQIQDITERKHAEEKIKRHQHYFERAQEMGAVGTWELDIVKNILIWTDQNYRNFGVPIGTPLTYEIFLNCIHPDDREYVNSEWVAAIKGKPYDIEHRIIIDGKVKWVREKADITFNKEGTGIYAIGFTQDITESRHFKEQLIHYHNLLDYVISHARSAIAVHDKNMNYVYVSDRYLKDYKVKEKDIIGKHHYKVFPDIPQKWRDVHQRALAGEVLSAEEDYFVREDGSKDWTRWECRPWYDSDGSIGGIIIYSEVITERKREEEELLKEKEFTETALNAQLDTFFLFQTPTGKAIRWNSTFNEITGYTDEEISSMPALDSYYGPEDLKRASVFMEQVLEKGRGKIELELLCKDGLKIPFEYNVAAMEGEAERTKYIISIGRDITERKLAEDTLAESEERYRLLSEVAFDGIVLTEKGIILEANTEFVKLFGYSYSEIIGKHVSEIIADDYRNYAMDKIKSGFDKPYESVCIKKDGTRYPVEVYGKTFSSDERTLRITAIRDITGRKTLEEELQKSQKLESIGVLAGGIAHDFNNLLTAIMNNLFLMKKDIRPEEKVYERIIATERASARAQSLTQQLLTFSKGGTPVKELIDIRELVSESISIALRGSNVRCENLIPYDVWHIEADAGQMNQAINNILINADQSMPEGGEITINCEDIVVGAENKLTLKEGSYIKISFTDQGSGISEEHLFKIFDPYFTTKQKGSGLGLSTTYSIISKHDGHITVESELGVGTVFNMYLPASAEKVRIKKPAEDGPVTGSGKVLIMDDEELVRDSLGQLLISIGYAVEFAEDGREAIDSYKNAMSSDHPFDAVIMDLTIPGGMGGKEAIRELVKIDPNVKAIVSSGYSNDPIMSNYREYGFSAVLTKPYKDIQELNRILNNMIDSKVK